MITVLPDTAGRAGTAQLRVRGAASAASAPGLRIRREGWDQGTLGPGGWQGEDALLVPDATATAGPDLLLTLGWAVCRHLEAGTYIVAIPQAGLDEAVSWPDIVPVRTPSRARARPAAAPAPAVAEVPAPLPLAIATEAALPPMSAGTTARRRASAKLAWVMAGIALLLVLTAGGGAWFWRRHAAVATVAATPPPAPPSRPASEQVLSGMSVPDVLRHAPDAAAIGAEGRRRLAGQQRDEGMLLLEEAADHGDAGAMSALGRLYDPVGFRLGGPIARPDPRQAARYYRDAQQSGATDNGDRRDSLRHWLEDRAAGGDLQANLILRDYWQ